MIRPEPLSYESDNEYTEMRSDKMKRYVMRRKYSARAATPCIHRFGDNQRTNSLPSETTGREMGMKTRERWERDAQIDTIGK